MLKKSDVKMEKFSRKLDYKNSNGNSKIEK